MAGAVKDRFTTRPGPSVQDLLRLERRAVPAALTEEYSDPLGTEDLSRERYFSREFLRLEMERMWSRVWQMACREEDLPNPGDHIIYEIGDYSLIVVRVRDNQINPTITRASIGGGYCAKRVATSPPFAARFTVLPGVSTGP